MFKITLPSTLLRGPNAYKDLKELQRVIDSQMPVEFHAVDAKIIAFISDINSIPTNQYGDHLGHRAVIGENESPASALIHLREEILAIGSGQRSREFLALGPGGLAHTLITFTP